MDNNRPLRFSFLEVLQILFIAFKLADVVDWSWWWVLSPMWISAIIAIIAFVAVSKVTKNKSRL